MVILQKIAVNVSLNQGGHDNVMFHLAYTVKDIACEQYLLKRSRIYSAYGIIVR